jgi:GTP pyrophosphokinase
MESRAIEDALAEVEFVVETVDVRHLNKMVQNLRKVSGVRDVQRAQKI